MGLVRIGLTGLNISRRSDLVLMAGERRRLIGVLGLCTPSKNNHPSGVEMVPQTEPGQFLLKKICWLWSANKIGMGKGNVFET